MDENSERTLTAIIKVTGQCNLRCPYCYNQSHWKDKQVLPLETLKEFVTKFKGKIRMITWHGGEPMFVGKQWYKDAYKIIQEIDPEIKFSMQTNLTLVDNEWIELFKEQHISVGFSFDGLDNENTRQHTEQIIDNFHKMVDNGFHIGCIMVVTQNNVHMLQENYEYFKALQIPVRFNPIFSVNETDKIKTVEEDTFVSQFCKFFDYWLYDNDTIINKISIYDRYIGMLIEDNRRLCDNDDCAGRWIGLYPNGDLYPCSRNHPAIDKFTNISKISDFNDLKNTDGFKSYMDRTRKYLGKCSKCLFFNSCLGGCYADAVNTITGELIPDKNICGSTQLILKYIYEKIKDIDLEKDYSKINPVLIKILQTNGYRSLSNIKNILT